MNLFYTSVTVIYLVIILDFYNVAAYRSWVTTDELENHISPEDLQAFLNWRKNDTTNKFGTEDESVDYDYAGFEDTTTVLPIPEAVDCFGLGPLARRVGRLFNMQPDSSDNINTHYFFTSRKQRNRVQVFSGSQFGLEYADYDPKRRTVMIVHGFMSHSNASWVNRMTEAFLEWDDVNVIAVDWSGGGNTWKYWRAVANTRTVGSDIVGFLKQLIKETDAHVKQFHFVGHSLGAHIVSYVSYHIGIVGRITGLDPAQPCFSTASRVERLDETDADFVDVIHTNGRLFQRLGFGLPDPIGHADFYPNGGMRQPGCANDSNSVWSRILPISKLQQAICSHGRAYLLFTESLINNNCTFRAHQWNLTYEGVNASIVATCDRRSSCSEMGIRAAGGERLVKARGAYFVLTTSKAPYCPTEWDRMHPRQDLLMDLRKGFRLDRFVSQARARTIPATYADPDIITEQPPPTTTPKNWFWRLFG